MVVVAQWLAENPLKHFVLNAIANQRIAMGYSVTFRLVIDYEPNILELRCLFRILEFK